jgi:hypothetical protein
MTNSVEIVFPSPLDLETALLSILGRTEFGLTTSQILEETVVALNVPQEVLKVIRSDGRFEFKYRLAWVRTKAKNKGIVEPIGNSSWRITDEGRNYLHSILNP